MKNVSLWAIGLGFALNGAPALAAVSSPQALVNEGPTETEAASPAEPITQFHTLATHLGLSAEDAVFSTPRTFRTNSFNDDKTELEPLAATSDDN